MLLQQALIQQKEMEQPIIQPSYYNPHEYGSKQVRSINTDARRKFIEPDNRTFTILPQNVPNAHNLVWADNMPRGGYATRNSRIEFG